MLPEVAYGEGPEMIHSDPPEFQPGSSSLPPSKGPVTLGLRRPTFWLLLVLIAVIIIAAVGGGVGGSLAVQDAKSVLSKSTTG